MAQSRDFRNESMHIRTIDFDKNARQIQKRSKSFSTNNTETEIRKITYLPPYKNINSEN